MISDEAVEAAAKRYYEASNYGRKWKLLGNSDQATERHRIRMALEAAAPYLLEDAWEEGRESMVYDQKNPRYDGTLYASPNPYRKAAK